MQPLVQPPKKTSAPLSRSSLLLRFSIGLIIFSLLVNLLWFTSYKQNNAAINDIRQAVVYYDTQEVAGVAYPYLRTLHTLYQIKQTTAQNHLFWFANWILPDDRTAKNLAEVAYRRIFQNEFLPDLQTILTIEMQSSTLQNPSDLYSALKVYLMLGKQLPRNLPYITEWFNHYWQRTLPNNSLMRLQLNKLLNDSLHQKNWDFFPPPDPTVIEQARNILRQLPAWQLSVAILEDQNSYLPPLSLFNAKTTELFSGIFKIPAIYTIAYLNKVYYQLIPQACQEVTNDSAVLGISPMQASNYGFNILINETRMAYLERYTQTWQHVLANISIAKSENLNQNLQLVGALSDFHSPLLHLYSLVITNTASNPGIPQFDTLVSNTFAPISKLLTQLTSPSWQQTWHNLDQYLSNVNNEERLFVVVSNRMSSQTYDDALSHLFQQAQTYPEPLKSWSLQIATNIWQLMLSNTQSYLNQVWANTVLPEYDAEINQHYPLFRTAQKDISLSAFTQFFQPGGTLDEFVTTYLKPFIDNSHHYWTWKNMDGGHINISAATLDMFIRAALVQQAYFGGDSNQLQISFELIPETSTASAHHFELQFDKEIVKYQGSTKFTWPNAKLDTINLQLDEQGKTFHFTAAGPWAWFRLLDQASVETIENAKQLEITFDNGGHAVKYRLEANGIINPFMPGILEGLHLPQRL